MACSCSAHREKEQVRMNVLDIEKTVSSTIRNAGGDDETVEIWEKTWKELSRCCRMTPGVSDDYTKDIVLCWSGWVLAADPEVTDCIYASTKGFNLEFKDDEDGEEGTQKLMRAIDRHVSDPANVYRELAHDQLDRLREQAAHNNAPKTAPDGDGKNGDGDNDNDSSVVEHDA